MKENVRLVYCIPGLYASSGMERVLTIKANYLADKMGYDVHVVLTEEKDKPFYFPLSPRIKVIHLDINFDRMHTRYRSVKKLLAYWYYLRLYKQRLKKVLFELRPDITISLLRREINFITSIKDGSRKVGEFHFMRDNYRQFHHPALPPFVCAAITRLWTFQLIRKLRKLDKFVTLTHEDEGKWGELTNVMCIHNPVSFGMDAPISTCVNSTVIAIGRYTYQKGYDLLLHAWSTVSERHPHWKLVVVGEGDRTHYLQLAESLQLRADSYFLEGATTAVADTLAEASIFVLSSRFEGFGVVLTEAMSCGIPPVAFACPCGPRDIIQDGIDGLLAENGNVMELADKICYLIEHDQIRKDMGKQARANVKRFEIEHIASQWDALFKTLADEKTYEDR